jgi:hypothetical protein
VIFDFAPQIEIGSEILSRRGEDQRLTEQRPASQRRRERDRAFHAVEAAADDQPAEDTGPAVVPPSSSAGQNEGSSAQLDSDSGPDHA